jgi:hypothetical protein
VASYRLRLCSWASDGGRYPVSESARLSAVTIRRIKLSPFLSLANAWTLREAGLGPNEPRSRHIIAFRSGEFSLARSLKKRESIALNLPPQTPPRALKD